MPRTILRLALVFFLPCLSTAATELTDIRMNAEKVDFDYAENVTNLSGSVEIRYGDFLLRADRARISTAEKKGMAEGNVMMLDGGRVFFCDRLEYDFRENRGSLTQGITLENVWVLTGAEVRRTADDRIEIIDAELSACQKPRPHYSMTARSLTLVPGKALIAKGAWFRVGDVPVLYLPSYRRRLDGKSTFGLRIRHNDRFGLQVLTRFRFHEGDHLQSRVRLDWHEKRGVGIGLDQKLAYERGEGEAYAYFIRDDAFEPNRSGEPAGTLDRYRVSVHHDHRFPSRWKSVLDVNTYSDLDFYDDYFSSEFDEGIQPDNRYRLSHATADYSTGLSLRYKLNDFENVLERLPQLHFDLYQRSLNDSNFYFSSTNQAVYLNQDYADSVSIEENDAFRFYSGNSLSYSRKYFGWLTFNPGIHAEAIWYSKHLEEVPADPPAGGNDETQAQASAYEEGGDALRFAGTATVNFSTSLYKIFTPGTPRFGFERFRHVMTPSFSYSYSPESNYADREIYSFDEIDTRPNENRSSLGFSLISRWQGKVRGQVETLLNNRYAVTYDLEAEEDPWGSFLFNSEIRFFGNAKIDLGFAYDIDEKRTDYFRTDLSYRRGRRLGFALVYWYRENDDDIIAPELSVNLADDWFFRAYAYYNEGRSLFERVEYSLVKSLHCMDFAVQYSEREFREEKTFFFTISPKGFSTRGVQFGNDLYSP
jgi:lipopolysaccharide assembly outer membrane protein LptD (OstA)